MVVIMGLYVKRIQLVGLVLWIDQNTFATGLLEKVFKKKDLPFYTLAQANDFVYLVEDLKPVLIVLDAQTALVQEESFKAQYESSRALRSLPFILIDGDIPYIQNVLGKISRPFDPFQIPEELKKISKLN